jgi:hypothetical protein
VATNGIVLCDYLLVKHKYIDMEHHKKLTELHEDSIQKLEEYLRLKGNLKEEDHKKLEDAKSEWQNAWTKMMDMLMVLERIEL